METRSVLLRILGEDRSARAAFDYVNAEGDKVDARTPTMKIGADASGAFGKMAALRGDVDELTSNFNSIKFRADDSAFNAKLAAMLAKLQGFRALADRPIMSDKMLAQTKADVLGLAAQFDHLIAKKAASDQKAGNGFPLIGEKPGDQHGFGSGFLPVIGGLPSVALFGGIAATSGLHILMDSVIELLATLVPAAVAVAAFSGALVALAPTAQMIYDREKAMSTATQALGQNFPLLTTKLNQFGQIVPTTAGSLDQLNQQFRPGVIQIWGDALTVASSGGGTIQKLLEMIVPWLDKFSARMAVDLSGGKSGFLTFVKQGAHDLGLWGAVLAPVGAALGNFLKVANQTHIAEDLMSVLAAGAKLLQLFSQLPQPLLVTLFALHGVYVWGGLAVTGLSKIAGVLGAIPGLGGLKALKDIPGMLDRVATKGLEAGAGIEFASVKGMRGLAVDTEGAVVKTGFLKTSLAALSEVPVWGWVAVGTIAIAAIGLAFLKTTDSSDKFNQSIDKNIASATNANVFNVMAADVGRVNDKISKLPSASQAASQAMQTTGMSGKNAYDNISGAVRQASARQQNYSQENQKILGQMSNFGTNVGYIMKTFGVSYPEALAIATQAGVKLTDNLKGNSKAAQDERQQIFGLVSGLSQLQGPSGLAGKDFQALAFASNDVTQKISQLNSAWHQWLGVVTGGQTSFDTFAQGMDVLNSSGQKFSEKLGILTVKGTQSKAAIDSLSQSGVNLNQSFMQQVANADSVIGALRSQNASQDTLEKSTKAMVAQLLPFAKGSKEATSVLFALATEANYTGGTSFKNLSDWAGVKTSDALKILKGQMNTSTTAASNLANTVDNLLTTDFQKFVYVNSGAQAALKKFTTDLMNNTDTTVQGRQDRLNLISDLEKSGMNAKQAGALVDGLSTSLGKIPKNTNVTVHESGSGQYTITGPGILASQGKGGSGNAAGGLATGGRIPGYGGGDKFPAMLEGGEAVVPKHLVSAIAPFLGAHHVPGFVSGGLIGSGSFNGSIGGLGSFTTGMHNTFVHDMTNSMISALKNGISQFAQMFSGSTGGSGVTRWASVILEALSLLGQSSSLLGAVEHRMNQESGGNPTIVNHWDSNAAAGTPSVGLMQVIGPTYSAYAGPFRGVGPFEYGTSVNPLANVYAGLNYALHNYPSLAGAMLQAGGYANGGIISEPMFAMGRSGRGLWLGEQGPELVTPLNRVSARTGGSSGGGDIYITVQAGDAIDPNAVAQAIHLRLRRYKQLKGGAPLGLD